MDYYFYSYLFHLPLVAVWLIGVVVAIKRRQRNPLGSRLMLIALSMLIVTNHA